MKLFLFVLFFSLFFVTGYSQSLQKKAIVYLVFQNRVGDSVLQSGVVYQNHFGESFSVRSCKYYISHVKIGYDDGSVFQSDSKPHLVNESDSGSKSLSFEVPSGNIKSIHFLLGIDSITNTNGVQTDDLDPAKGMFWIWNTGYIMAKLEGSSASSKAPGKQFSYDIGGFKKDENVTRDITLPVHVTAAQQRPIRIVVGADVSQWFWGKHDIKIADQPMCHSPGVLAMQVADNYANMFHILMVN